MLRVVASLLFSVLPDVSASKVFDDLPHWDNNATWDDEEMSVGLSFLYSHRVISFWMGWH